MNPYSPDLRQRVLAALRTHLDTQKDVAQCFSVCLSTVEKWWHAWRTSRRSHAHRRKHAGPRRTLADSGPFLRATLKHQPDLTLAELSACVLAEQQVVASPSMLCRELHRLRLPRKQKSLQDSQRKTPRVRRLRRQFVARQAAELDALLEKLHFIADTVPFANMWHTCKMLGAGKLSVKTGSAAKLDCARCSRRAHFIADTLTNSQFGCFAGEAAAMSIDHVPYFREDSLLLNLGLAVNLAES